MLRNADISDIIKMSLLDRLKEIGKKKKKPEAPKSKLEKNPKEELLASSILEEPMELVDFSDDIEADVQEAKVPGLEGLEDISEVDESKAAELLTSIFGEGAMGESLSYGDLSGRALIVPSIRRNSEGEVVERTHYAFLYKGHGKGNCIYYLYKQNGRSVEFSRVFKGKFEDLRHRKKAEIEFISYCFREYLESRGVKTRPYKPKEK